MMELRAVKRISLEGIGEGWDNQAYIKLKTHSAEDFKKLQVITEDLIKKSKEDNLAGQFKELFSSDLVDLYKGLFVEGKGYFLVDTDGKIENKLQDLQPEHLDELFLLPGVRDRVREGLVKDERLKE